MSSVLLVVCVVLCLCSLQLVSVSAATVTFYADTTCSGTSSSYGVNNNGNCNSVSEQGQTAYYKLSCPSSGNATFTIYGDSACAITGSSGTGTGDGNTCFPTYTNGVAVNYIKVKCNAAYSQFMSMTATPYVILMSVAAILAMTLLGM